MADLPGTRASLLVRLRDKADADAWRQFAALYAPLIHALARKRGLQDADAADLTQEVLRSVVTAIPKLAYDPAKGTFRGWLYTIARRRIHDHLDASRGHGVTVPLVEELPAPEEEAKRWDEDYRQHVFNLAAAQVRQEFGPATWQAFWLLAVEGRSGADVGQATGLSAGAAYVAKSRVLARIKQKVAEIEEA